MTEAFKRYQQVCCTGTEGYEFTAGKLYVVLHYDPPSQSGGATGFIWPAYVYVYDDKGDVAACHAWRFKSIPRNEYNMRLYDNLFEVDVHYGVQGDKSYYTTEPYVIAAMSEDIARDIYEADKHKILERTIVIHKELPTDVEATEVAREVRNVFDVYFQMEYQETEAQRLFLIAQNSALQEKMHSLEAEAKKAERERSADFYTHKHIEEVLRNRIMELETYIQEHKND